MFSLLSCEHQTADTEPIALVGAAITGLVTCTLSVPHAFPVKIFGLRMWEVKKLRFEVFMKHSSHPLIYALWDSFCVKHLVCSTLDKRNI